MKQIIFKGIEVTSKKGDLTKTMAGAIVNPANSSGQMGGGVAAAIRELGGERIERDAMAVAPIKVGSAAITSAGALPSRFVIHAPTMTRPAEQTNSKAVFLAALAALTKANEVGVESVAFPGMGTGVGRVKPIEAANAMLMAIKQFITSGKNKSLKKIILFSIDDELEKAFDQAIEIQLR